MARVPKAIDKRYMKSVLKTIFLWAAAGFSCTVHAQVKPGTRPNIIFILADDLGYMDLNAYATKTLGTPASAQFYETPNINRLAAEGMAFSQAYANPLCSPTRASIITGKYAARMGFMTATAGSASTFYNRGEKAPPGFKEQDALWGDKIDIQQAWINGYTNIALPSGQPQDSGVNETTLAEALQGYTSAFIGKWHLGGHGSEGYQPHDQGFHEIAYLDAGSSPYYKWKNEWNRKQKQFPKMRQAVLMQGRPGDSTGRDYLTDDLTTQAENFLVEQAAAKQKKPFFLYFCEFAVHSPLQAPKTLEDYFANKKTRGWNGQRNATYAAMIKTLDESVGRIMAKLRATGLDENTLVVFMSDNGGIAYDAKSTNGLTTSNAPLKGSKAMVYEGGIRVPLILWQKNQPNKGAWCDVPVHCTDLFPTLLRFAGQKPDVSTIDGRSIKPLLTDPLNKKGAYIRNTFYWHYPLNVKVDNPDDGLSLTPHSAIRKGDYKLIFDWYGRLGLYNIKKDISEKNNLAFKLPAITKQLFADLMVWLDKNVDKKFIPTLNPDFQPEKESRKVPFVNLYAAYKEGKDIIQLAH